MKYGSIKGGITAKGYEDWIELTSFQWGLSRSISTSAPGSTPRECGAPSIKEIAVTKLADVSTPKLFLEAVAGKLDSKVTIEFTRTTEGKVETYLKYELENVGLSHFSVSSAGDRPTETCPAGEAMGTVGGVP